MLPLDTYRRSLWAETSYGLLSVVVNGYRHVFVFRS
jgi:hypothetical protein